MYSPGTGNVSVVVVLPVTMSGGREAPKVTSPGPRNLLHETVATGLLSGSASGGRRPSSLTHTVNPTGSPTFAWSEAAKPCGGPWNGTPSGANLTAGGVFESATSLNGLMIQREFKLSGMDVVCPFAAKVHVSFLSPKSFGTVIVKTPHWRRGRKCVGCP